MVLEQSWDLFFVLFLFFFAVVHFVLPVFHCVFIVLTKQPSFFFDICLSLTIFLCFMSLYVYLLHGYQSGGWPVHVCLAIWIYFDDNVTIAKFTVMLVLSTTVQVSCSVSLFRILNHCSIVRYRREWKHPGFSYVSSLPIPVTSVGQLSGEGPGPLGMRPRGLSDQYDDCKCHISANLLRMTCLGIVVETLGHCYENLLTFVL